MNSQLVGVLFCFCLASGLALFVRDSIPTIGILEANEVCYEHYGCFSTESPWRSVQRPLAGLPSPPYEIGTRFLLFTRSNPYYDFELVPDNKIILGYSPFDKTKKTVVLIHGFTDSHLSKWMIQSRNALLEKEDINVISLDWAPGAAKSYLKATNNARLVGAQLTRMLKFLAAKADLDVADLRIVGHSIGAHIAGYAGEALQGAIGQITALDPADQYFSGTHISVRLDESDANIVHVVHTNGDSLFGMGMKSSVGHVDIFPNGGSSQPGCSDSLGSIIGAIGNLILWDFEGAIGEYACSHVRAVDFYVESIKSPCPFVARKCNSYEEYSKGKCNFTCKTSGSCTVLGYGAEKHGSCRGNYYLTTDSTNTNYCFQSVLFDTSVMPQQEKTDGVLTFSVSFDGIASEKYTVANGQITAGQVLSSWVNIPSKIMASASVKPVITVRYERNGMVPIIHPRYLNLDSISLYVVNEDLQTEQIRYNGGSITLDAGKDTVIIPED